MLFNTVLEKYIGFKLTINQTENFLLTRLNMFVRRKSHLSNKNSTSKEGFTLVCK